MAYLIPSLWEWRWWGCSHGVLLFIGVHSCAVIMWCWNMYWKVDIISWTHVQFNAIQYNSSAIIQTFFQLMVLFCICISYFLHLHKGCILLLLCWTALYCTGVMICVSWFCALHYRIVGREVMRMFCRIMTGNIFSWGVSGRNSSVKG